MAFSLQPQGVLNRLRGSIVFPQFPQYNITAPFLGDEGINLTPGGDITDILPTMTGTVQSPAPYQMYTVEVALLKTQSFSDQFKRKLELDANVGNFVVRPDSPTLGNYIIQNAAITNAGPGRLNGRSVGFAVTLVGYYSVNNSLYTSA
jgi:hypothetical protein